MLFLILALTGVFVGLLSAFFGVGGGVIIVPVLYGLFPDATPSVVIATSLCVIFFNSIVNTYNFSKLKLPVKNSWGILLALGMCIGILISTEIVTLIKPKNIKIFFGVILFVIAFRTLFFKKPESEKSSDESLKFSKVLIIILTGVAGGLIAGLTGLGGGIVVVPLLLTLLKTPLKIVPVYSNMAMAGGTLVGMIRYSQVQAPELISEGLLKDYQIGSVHFALALIIFIGSYISSKKGASLSQKVNKKTSKRLFAALLILSGTKILYTTLL